MFFQKILSGLNMKRLLIATLAVFGFIWISDFLIHAIFMQQAYEDTSYLWRSEAEMQSYFVWMLLAQFLMAKGFTTVFAKGYEGEGIMEGIRFSLFIAPLVLATNFVWYAVSPITPNILWSWVGFGFLQVLGCGIVAALVYKK